MSETSDNLGLFARLPDLVETILTSLGYLGLTFLMILENLFPPLPSELILPLTGSLVALGSMHLALVLLASVVGSLLGALVIYWLGRRLGEARVRGFLRRYGRYFGLPESAYDRAAGVLLQHSGAVLFWGRFVPGLRSAISLPAGVARVPIGVFVGWTLLSSLLWNAILVGAGVLLVENWSRVLFVMDQYELVLLWSAGMFALGIGVIFALRKIRRSWSRAALLTRKR